MNTAPMMLYLSILVLFAVIFVMIEKPNVHAAKIVSMNVSWTLDLLLASWYVASSSIYCGVTAMQSFLTADYETFVEISYTDAADMVQVVCVNELWCVMYYETRDATVGEMIAWSANKEDMIARGKQHLREIWQ